MTNYEESSNIRDLTQIRLNELSNEEVVYCHLSRRGWEEIQDYTVHSTLVGVETEMRQSRAINNISNYAPLLAGFSILEQLGNSYSNRKMKHHPKSGSGIEHALYFFCGYEAMSDDVKALYALRNGLMHAASLTSMDQGSGKRYIFRYNFDIDASIQIASVDWDGQLSTIDSSVITLINPRKLTEQISSAIDCVRELFDNDRKNLRILRTRGQIMADHLIWN